MEVVDLRARVELEVYHLELWVVVLEELIWGVLVVVLEDVSLWVEEGKRRIESEIDWTTSTFRSHLLENVLSAITKALW